MQRGSIVTNHGSGESYVVSHKISEHSFVASKIIVISNPAEWEEVCPISGEPIRVGRKPYIRWTRTASTSILSGPSLELVVVQNSGSDESWSWTARGWREPGESNGAVNGWVSGVSRRKCEEAAFEFYTEEDE